MVVLFYCWNGQNLQLFEAVEISVVAGPPGAAQDKLSEGPGWQEPSTGCMDTVFAGCPQSLQCGPEKVGKFIKIFTKFTRLCLDNYQLNVRYLDAGMMT
jgi:hypothetical protein